MEKIIKNEEGLIGSPALKRGTLMRFAARTRRCHTQMVIHHQSVGEHTFGTLAILDMIAPDCRKEVWRAMLYHDAPEAITGDVPAPAKWRFYDLEKELRNAEQHIMDDHWIHVELYEHEYRLVKFADIMELVWYGIEEMGMGNKTASQMVNAALCAVATRDLLSNLATHQFFEYTLTMFEAAGGHYDGR